MARVLVIDDDEEQRTLVRAMLVRVGHRVEEARDGVEGLRAVGELTPAVVLTDISMPKLDGHEVISALKTPTRGCRSSPCRAEVTLRKTSCSSTQSGSAPSRSS